MREKITVVDAGSNCKRQKLSGTPPQVASPPAMALCSERSHRGGSSGLEKPGHSPRHSPRNGTTKLVRLALCLVVTFAALLHPLGRVWQRGLNAPSSSSGVRYLLATPGVHGPLRGGPQPLENDGPTTPSSSSSPPPPADDAPSIPEVPRALAFPSVCLQRGGFVQAHEVACYTAVEAQFESLVAVDETAPFCWGNGAGDLGAPIALAVNDTPPAVVPGAPRLLFHTIALTGVPPLTTALLLNSFLATQCCDAQLWFWVSAGETIPPALPGFVVPPGHEGRIVWKVFDPVAEWAAVAGQFSPAHSARVAAMTNYSDVRLGANWARLLLLYVYGGVYLDIDVAFLRDMRPLFAVPAFAYREAAGNQLNNALLRIRAGPDPTSFAVLNSSMVAVRPSRSVLTATLQVWLQPHRRGRTPFALVSQYVLEQVWLRTTPHEPPALARVHPELSRVRKDWDAFFAPAQSDEQWAWMQRTHFATGSYATHWHNRYHKGLPARSWAGLLNDRYAAMAARKAPVCGGTAGGSGAGGGSSSSSSSSSSTASSSSTSSSDGSSSGGTVISNRLDAGLGATAVGAP